MKKKILTIILSVFMLLGTFAPIITNSKVLAESIMTIGDLEKEETAPKSVSIEELGNTFLTTVDINSTIAIRERIDELERQLRPIYEQEDYVKAGDQLLKEPAYYEMKELYERLKYLEITASPVYRKAKATMYLPTNNSTRYNYTHGINGYGSSDYIYHMQMSDGRAVFCIELGKRANNGETYTESSFDNLHKKGYMKI